MARDFTPGRIGLSTATRLGMAITMAMILTHTIARKEDASNFSSITMKTIPAEAKPKVKSKTHNKTVECLSETQPQQQEFATLKHLKNFGSGDCLEIPNSFASSMGIPGPWSIGAISYVMSLILLLFACNFPGLT